MSIGYYLQVIVTLGLLSLAAYGILRALKEYQSRQYTGDMHVIDRLIVGPQCTLVIVEIRHTHYLFSITGKEVRLVEKLG